MSEDEDLFDVFKDSDPDGPTPVPHPSSPHRQPTPPLPVFPLTSPTCALGQPLTSPGVAPRGGGGGLVVVQGSPPAVGGELVRSGGGPYSAAATAGGDPRTVHVEPHSGISVRRVTRSFEQLAVRLAEYPYTSFRTVQVALRQALARCGGGGYGDARGGDRGSGGLATPPVLRTCIGVLVRKSDPKQSTSSRRPGAYAVCTLWSMRGVSPPTSASPDEECSFLLSQDAFTAVYGQLAVGAVVAISRLTALPPRSGGGAPGSHPSATAAGGAGSSSSSSSSSSTLLLRVSDREDIRLLGYAATLGTCASVARQSGEPCRSLVNTQLSKHCSFHAVAGLRAARAASASSTTSTATVPRVSATPTAARRHIAGGLVTPVPAAGTPTGLSPRLSHHPLASSTTAATPLARAPVTPARRPSQPLGFLTVHGRSGLPVSGTGPLGTRSSLSATVYGTIDRGPLVAARTTELAPPVAYPSARAMGVSAKGLDMLAAARAAAVQSEHERLLRGAMGHGEASAPPVARRSAEEHEDAMEPGKSRGLRKRERAEECAEVAQSLQASRPSAAAGIVAQLKQQFAPLRRAGADLSFRPLSFSGGAVERVVGPPAGLACTARTAVEDAVRSALRQQDPQLQRQVREAKAAARPAGCDGKGLGAPTMPTSVLSALADHVDTAGGALVRAAERERVGRFLDQQAQVEAALRVLEDRVEVAVTATYCHSCREWFPGTPALCVSQHHRLERLPTVRRFYACEHCGCKTSCLGEDTKPWRLMPRCPRCAKEVTWVKSSAAPEVARAVPEGG